MVHQEEFESPTSRFVAECSIQLSYWCNNIYIIHQEHINFNYFFLSCLKKHFNISERTVFRRINEALSMASMKAEELGYNKEKLENEFKDEKWLFDLGEVAENDDYIKIDNDYLKKVIREYKKFSYAN